MRFLAVTTAALGILGSAAAFAQTTVIERSAPSTSVTVERRDAPVAVEHKSVTTTNTTGCSSTTVHKENDLGESKTVHKESC